MKFFSFLIMALSCSKSVALGLVGGALAPCNNAWNCAITQEFAGQKSNAQALYYSGSAQEALAKLKNVFMSFPRVHIVSATDNYLHATFTSWLFRFVDDVECYFPQDEKVIHIRSASRMGKYDFGVNKRRIREIKKRFEK